MRVLRVGWLGIALLVLSPLLATADDEATATSPKSAPRTRPEMKSALEQLKHRRARLNLPPPQAGEESGNNGRARAYFLPSEWQTPSSFTSRSGPNTQRGPSDPAMTLDNVFTVQMFWISARLNNCHY